MNRVPGEPLYTKDLNCGCIDPNKDFVLNPKAWVNPAPGEWGVSPVFYSDYRHQRRPSEQFSFGRMFRVKERASFSIRAEFFNAFNNVNFSNPGGSFGTSNFGRSTGTQNAQRSIQLGLKLYY